MKPSAIGAPSVRIAPGATGIGPNRDACDDDEPVPKIDSNQTIESATTTVRASQRVRTGGR